MDERSSGRVVAKEPCPACGSRDNLARYEDGSAYCFTPWCARYEPATGEAPQRTERRTMSFEPIEGEVRELKARGISAETCAKFGYKVGEVSGGRGAQIAPFHKGRDLVGQKARLADKTFFFNGDVDGADLWGMHLWPDKGQRVVVTEGEIDAMSVAQAFNLSWPVVSLTRGAAGAKKDIQRNLKWLEGYDQVVLWFDDDEAGHRAVADCSPLFSPGKCRVAYAGGDHKDANDMLRAGDLKALTRCVYDAQQYRPEGVVSLKSLRSRVLTPTTLGTPWPWPGLTKSTYGRRDGAIYALGAGSGVGKTDFFTQLIAFDSLELGIKCGVLYLEQSIEETGKRIAGKLAGKRFHIPDGSWTQEELEAAWETIEARDNLELFDSFGANSWDVIGPTIRYMVVSLGCKHIFLDHLTALAAAEEDERTALEKIMERLASMAKELGCIIHFVSHLSTPEGKPHEEGGRVMAKHFKGSRAIIFWSHVMLGLERNTQAETEEERAVTILRCLKERQGGDATGKTWSLHYDRDTGLLTEQEPTGAFGPINNGRDF